MPLPRLAVAAASALLAVPLLFAQAQAPEPGSSPPPPPGQTWAESPMDALADHASFHTDFTFDKSMLNAFSQTVPEQDRPIVAKLRSVTIHSFRYSAPGMYNPAALAAVRSQYNGNGWQHLVSRQAAAHPPQPDGSPAPDGSPMAGTMGQPLDPTRTDVWIRTDHTNVDGAVVIVANEKNINWVVIDGMISPLDLLHLRGHLGIPQFDDGGAGAR